MKPARAPFDCVLTPSSYAGGQHFPRGTRFNVTLACPKSLPTRQFLRSQRKWRHCRVNEAARSEGQTGSGRHMHTWLWSERSIKNRRSPEVVKMTNTYLDTDSVTPGEKRGAVAQCPTGPAIAQADSSDSVIPAGRPDERATGVHWARRGRSSPAC